jgi:hypothetical protein
VAIGAGDITGAAAGTHTGASSTVLRAGRARRGGLAGVATVSVGVAGAAACFAGAALRAGHGAGALGVNGDGAGAGAAAATSVGWVVAGALRGRLAGVGAGAGAATGAAAAASAAAGAGFDRPRVLANGAVDGGLTTAAVAAVVSGCTGVLRRVLVEVAMGRCCPVGASAVMRSDRAGGVGCRWGEALRRV